MPTVHALPGAGKTFATRAAGHSGWLLDFDETFRKLMGVKASKAAMDAVFADSERLDFLRRRVRTFSAPDSRFILLMNVNPDLLAAPAALRVAYTPDDYVTHLHACGRTDLTDKFGETTLRQWATDHVVLSEARNAPKTIWLRPGQFLSDIPVIASQDYAALNRAAGLRYSVLDMAPFGSEYWREAANFVDDLDLNNL